MGRHARGHGRHAQARHRKQQVRRRSPLPGHKQWGVAVSVVASTAALTVAATAEWGLPNGSESDTRLITPLDAHGANVPPSPGAGAGSSTSPPQVDADRDGAGAARPGAVGAQLRCADVGASDGGGITLGDGGDRGDEQASRDGERSRFVGDQRGRADQASRDRNERGRVSNGERRNVGAGAKNRDSDGTGPDGRRNRDSDDGGRGWDSERRGDGRDSDGTGPDGRRNRDSDDGGRGWDSERRGDGRDSDGDGWDSGGSLPPPWGDGLDGDFADADTAEECRGLLWSDEFDGVAGAAPDLSTWTAATGYGWGKQELQCYTARPRNLALDGTGNLVITAVRERSCDGATFSSARIETAGKLAIRHAYVEVRAKLPTARGSFPAVWMVGTDLPHAGWPASGELDVVEVVAAQPKTVHTNIHWAGENGRHREVGWRGGGAFNAGVNLGADYHTYGVERTPTQLRFFFDGVLIRTINRAQAPSWPWDGDFYLLLNLAIDGQGARGADGEYPQQMVVDYVRIYDAMPTG